MGLHWIDGVIVTAYAGGMLALGVYFSLRQKNSDEYFVGNRAMSPLLIGVSMFATLFSTVSYLSTPGEIIKHGPVLLTGTLSIPLTYLIVGYVMLPVYMRYRATSAYELLEARLGVATRLVGATLFILLRLVWMATLIYFASDAMMTMLELDKVWLPAVTLTTGAVAIAYSSIGGMRAVVITDLFQFLLLFGGAVLVVGTVTYRQGGFDWFPTSWNPTWDTQPWIGWPTTRVTVLTTILHGMLWWICTAGSDQTAIQRFMATGDARAARRSFLINSIAGVAVSVVLALVGFSLLSYFQSAPERLKEGMTIAENSDQLFPYFISHHLRPGLSGLVVSGMFAAAMSSLDSGINSISAVVMTDYVERFRPKPLTERQRVRWSRSTAFAVGIFVVGTSSFMQYVPGNFLEISQRSLGLFVTPLFVLFLLALLSKRTSQVGAISGAVAALIVAALVGYSESIPLLPAISFQWILASSLLAGTIVGLLVSYVTGRSHR